MVGFWCAAVLLLLYIYIFCVYMYQSNGGGWSGLSLIGDIGFGSSVFRNRGFLDRIGIGDRGVEGSSKG